jgi:regulatory protein
MKDQRASYPRAAVSKEKALEKLKHYCGYQERCHQEVKEKLYSLGLFKPAVEEIMADLISENYLNEERFAIQFATGRFRMKGWGKIRIRYELKQKRLSDYCIRKALGSIDQEEYLRGFTRIARKKWEALKTEKNLYTKKGKWQQYLVQKGYEPALFGDFDFKNGEI